MYIQRYSTENRTFENFFSEKTQTENLDIDFLKSTVKQIKVSHNFTIEAEFINGIKIRNTTER